MSNYPVLPTPDQIFSVPDGASALSGEAKQALLKIPADQRAEVDQALEQIWEHRDDLPKDLGSLAPDAGKGKGLHERVRATREANAKAQALASFTDEQEMLAGHEVMSFINSVADDVEHMAKKNPLLAERYDKVLTVVRQRRQAVATGIARAKTKKDAKKDAEPVTD